MMFAKNEITLVLRNFILLIKYYLIISILLIIGLF